MTWCLIKLLRATSESHVWAPVQIPRVPLLTQPPANAPGSAAEDGPQKMVLQPWTHVGDSEKVSGSRLQPGPAVVIIAIWGANQSLSLSLYIYRQTNKSF